MAKLLKLRRGTTTQHGSFTGAEGEVTIDTDKEVPVVHDGSTAGGHPVAAEDMANVSSASIAGRLATDSIATTKIAAGALPTDVTIVSTNIVDDTIVNADIKSDAAIAHSKLASVTDGQILVGNGSDVPTAVAVSGDVTLANTGAVTIATGAVEHAMLAGDAVDGDNIADDSVNSEHYVDDSIDTQHIANGQVTYAKMQNVSATDKILGRDSAGAGVIEEIAPSALRTMINVEDGATADQNAAEIVALVAGQAIAPSTVYATSNIGKDAGDYISFTTDTQMDIYVNGNNEFRFEADGDFHADGDVIAESTTISSDAKLKESIQVVPNALDKVQQLNGVTFNWIRSGEKSAGVIAQDVLKVLPEAVKEVKGLKDNDTHLTVNYHALTSILIESIKELKAEVEALKAGGE
tara:strand:- start:492 stop:1715 length:1224 start_codon:yes stop_codon:yes gene_type:complete